MALLTTAKGKFADLGRGSNYKEDEEPVDRKLSRQREDAKERLVFLLDEKYLSLLGTCPSEDEKLTKIVVFSRNAQHLVKMVLDGFGLPELMDYETVRPKATMALFEIVKLKTGGHLDLLAKTQQFTIQLINETKFSLKIISATVVKLGSDLTPA